VEALESWFRESQWANAAIPLHTLQVMNDASFREPVLAGAI
jgi:hypothetical protein